MPKPPTSSGHPDTIRFRNEYRHCRQEWVDDWTCMCNDRCPQCNAEIEPCASTYIGSWWVTALVDDEPVSEHGPFQTQAEATIAAKQLQAASSVMAGPTEYEVHEDEEVWAGCGTAA